jgi:hypothetical protein
MLTRIALILFGFGAVSGSVHAAPISAFSDLEPDAQSRLALHLTFDGQCDGLSITINAATAIAHATRTGCLTGDLSGTLGILVTTSSTGRSVIGPEVTASQSESITLAEDYTDAEAVDNRLTIINTSGTFSVYHIPDLTLVSSGTFTVVAGGGSGRRHGG